MRETGHKLDMPAKAVVLDRIQEESKKDTLLDISLAVPAHVRFWLRVY